MTRILLTAFLALFALSAATPATAEKLSKKEMQEIVKLNKERKSLLYQALDTASEKDNPALVMDTIKTGIRTGGNADRDVAIRWLDDHTFGTLMDQKHFNAFYFLYLSDLKSSDAVAAQQLGKVDAAEEAAAVAVRALMTFEIVANADAERCDDTPSKDEKPLANIIYDDLVAPRFHDLAFAFQTSINKEKYDLMSIDALEIEGAKSARPINTQLCMLSEKAKKSGSFTPPATEDLKLWNMKRNVLRTQFKKTWTSRYYKVVERARQ